MYLVLMPTDGLRFSVKLYSYSSYVSAPISHFGETKAVISIMEVNSVSINQLRLPIVMIT